MGTAIDEVKLLCQMSGLCADDFPTREEALGFRRFWDDQRAKTEPAPSGQEVIAGMHADMANAAMRKAAEQTVSVIEDGGVSRHCITTLSGNTCVFPMPHRTPGRCKT